MSTASPSRRELQLIRSSVVRLRAGLVAIAFGMVSGCGLFVATIWLVLRGGKRVGLHLSLLGNYFPGYSVTWVGAFVGFFYAAIVGGVAGWLLGWLYNWMVDLRHPRPESESVDA